MRKRLIGVILVFVMLSFGLMGCSADSSDLESLKAEIENLKSENEKLQDENEELKTEIAKSAVSTNSVVDNTIQEDKKEGIKTISLAEPVNLDFVEFTLEAAEWKDELLPSNISGVYSYYEDIENETYFVFKGIIKNVSGEAYSIGDMVSQFVFNDKYKYTGITVGESEDHTDLYGDYLNPLQSTVIYIYVSVPDEIKEQFQTCNLTFGFDNNFSNNMFDAIEEVDIRYNVQVGP